MIAAKNNKLRNSLLFAVLLMIFFVLSLALTSPALASKSCGDVQTTVIGEEICGSGDDLGGGIKGVVNLAISILTGLVGVAAVGAVVAAGIRYSSAGGDASKVAAAKKLLFNTTAGLIAFAFAATALNFIIPGGLFATSEDDVVWLGPAPDWSGGGSTGGGSKPSTGGGNNNNKPSTGGGNNSGSTGTATGPVKGKAVLTFASWNVYGKNHNNIGGKVRGLMSGIDAIGLQEVHWQQQRDAIKKISSPTIGVYFAPRPKSGDKHMSSYPIIYNRSKLSLISSGYKRLGATGGLSIRYVVYVKFKIKATNQDIYFANTHLPPGIEEGGRPSGGKYSGPYQLQMPVLKNTLIGLQREKIPLFLAGDLNVNWRRDKCSTKWFPCSSLGSIGMKAAFSYRPNDLGGSIGTHTGSDGSRLIDYVFVWDRADVKVDSVSVLGTNKQWYQGSDHRPSRAKVTIGK